MARVKQNTLYGAGHGQIIRQIHHANYTQIPNAIASDPRLSLAAKGLLLWLLSRPPGWQTRVGHVEATHNIGKKLCKRLLGELESAGYVTFDAKQGRDQHQRFTHLNIVARDVPLNVSASERSEPQRAQPQRQKSDGYNNKKENNTDSTKRTAQKISTARGDTQHSFADKYSEAGLHALGCGEYPVWFPSDAYDAWLAYRGSDGMPTFKDRAYIDGRWRDVVWLPKLWPPNRAKD